jgi:metallophosphoesterase superfamily enzyme
LLNIAGHVHPGFTLFGAGRQSAKLPCFYMHQQTMLLPAFGGLTGLYNMQARPDAQVFLVLSDEVRRWRK